MIATPDLLKTDIPLSEKLILMDTFVKEFWGKRDKRLQRILKVMDGVEHWVPEGDEDMDDLIAEVGSALSLAEPAAIEASLDVLITALAYMSASKAMRIMTWLEETHPALFREMLERLEDHDQPKAARLSGRRMKVLQSLNLMGRVFNPKRSQRIVAWLRAQSLGNDASA
jgi:hypothetical protein